MTRFRPLLMAATAAGLLAAGCDYWRNLVDDKTVATAHLKLKVRDVYTLDGVVATCIDSNRGLEMKTVGSGHAEMPNAGTGMYTIHCKGYGYYDKAITFPLTPASDTVVFDLPRLGGEGLWYKDHPTRAVRIREKFDTLRFPRDFDFNAYPEDTTKDLRFRYVWTFAKAKGLDLLNDSENSKFPIFHLEPDSANASPGPDTLTLQVWSLMNDPQVPYYIGMDRRPFVWARNQRPILTLNRFSQAPYTVGCPESQPLRITSSAVDPDGECKSVRYYTVDTTSSFGAVDTTVLCTRSDPRFLLRNTFESLRSDSALQRENELKISVTDDNGERFDTSIVITTRSNRLPTVITGIENSRTYAFTGDSIKIYFETSDGDGTPQWAVVNWIDEGETHMDYRNRTGNTLRDSALWSYGTPGRKFFKVVVRDLCNAWVNSETDSILIRDNRVPEVELKYLRNEGTAQDHLYVFQLTAKDKDISEGLDDRITEVYVNWGEGSRLLESPGIGSTYIKTVKHHFSQPPDSLGRYQIVIDVQDAHRGIGTLNTMFLIP